MIMIFSMKISIFSMEISIFSMKISDFLYEKNLHDFLFDFLNDS
jgi:hypothetical protein